MKLQLAVCAVLTIAVLFLTGCGRHLDSEGYFVLRGAASWNGEPIHEGLVIFRTTESGRRNVAAPIKNGEFEVRIQPGKKQVEITAMREVPGKFTLGASGEKVAATESFIPKQFNSETNLSVDITFPDNEDLNFDLSDM